MLDEGVVADAADIDLAMITGAGWPFWLGGITPYLDRAGVSERATGRRFAPPGVATLPCLSHAGPGCTSADADRPRLRDERRSAPRCPAGGVGVRRGHGRRPFPAFAA